MAFKKGQVANPKGRPKGSRNKKDVLAEALTSKAVTEGELPLAFMLRVMRNPKAGMLLRCDMAKAAAPYCHRKLPQAVEHSGGQTFVHKGGVMIVPATESTKDWEARASAAQAALKADVKK